MYVDDIDPGFYSYDSQVVVHLGHGNGTFDEQATALEDSLAIWLDVGDVTGDGLADIVTTYGENFSPSHMFITVHAGAANDGFAPPVTTQTHPGGDAPVTLADIDGNGVEEVIVLALAYEFPRPPVSSLLVASATPAGAVTPHTIIGP